MSFKAIFYFILVVVGFGLFVALIQVHGEEHNLGKDYYWIAYLALAGAAWVAFTGVFNA